MRELWVSARNFGAGVGRRLWALVPGAVLGLAGIYDAFVKPNLPSEWRKVPVTVPLWLVLTILAVGFVWAALLTYHELRMDGSKSKPAGIHVEPGATYINAPGANFVLRPPPKSRTEVGPEQEVFWKIDDGH